MPVGKLAGPAGERGIWRLGLCFIEAGGVFCNENGDNPGSRCPSPPNEEKTPGLRTTARSLNTCGLARKSSKPRKALLDRLQAARKKMFLGPR